MRRVSFVCSVQHLVWRKCLFRIIIQGIQSIVVGNGMVAEVPGSVLWDAFGTITSLWIRKQRAQAKSQAVLSPPPPPRPAVQ